MTARPFVRRFVYLALAICIASACAAPIVPDRSKPGGSARWAETAAWASVSKWAADAQLCRVAGAGIGSEGWLPDHGGTWQLYYWSPSKQPVLVVSIDSDGGVKTLEQAKDPARGHTLPTAWQDSPKVWAATRGHQKNEPLHTFDAEMAYGADADHAKDRIVWRIRFWEPDNTYETHVLTPEGVWLASY